MLAKKTGKLVKYNSVYTNLENRTNRFSCITIYQLPSSVVHEDTTKITIYMCLSVLYADIDSRLLLVFTLSSKNEFGIGNIV